MLTEGEGYKEVQLGPKKDEVPINWKVLKLKNVAKIINGSTPSKGKKEFWNGDIVFITPTDITENDSKYISNSKEKITDEGLNSCSTHLLEPGAVLMTSRATIGEASINKIPVCTNQGFKSIVTGEELHNEYFYYYIPLIKGYLNAIGGGSTFSEINKGDTESIKIPLPPIPEQMKIAEVLSTADNAIQKTEEIIERAKELKKGLMQDLLTKGIGHEEFKEVQLGTREVTIPKDWGIEQLNNISRGMVFGGTPDTDKKEYWGGRIPWTTCAYVKGPFFSDQKGFITKSGLENSSSTIVPKGSILFGTRVTVANTAKTKQDIAISQDLMGITPNSEVNSDYLTWYLTYNQEHIANQFSQGSTISGIIKSDIKRIQIPLPSLPEQKKIANILSTVDQKIKREQNYKEKLEELKKGLMQDLLTGKVRVLPLLSAEEKEELKETDVPG